jgi:hypothetical protein
MSIARPWRRVAAAVDVDAVGAAAVAAVVLVVGGVAERVDVGDDVVAM